MAKRCILIVDDDAVIRKLLAVNLRLAGFAVETAVSGAEAMDKVRSDPPDSVVLDLMMPGMDGWEVCRMLKEEPEFAKIPIVLLSARVWGKDRERGYALGVSEFITKPFDPADLVDAVRRALAADHGEGAE